MKINLFSCFFTKPVKGFFCRIVLPLIITYNLSGQTTYTWTGTTSSAWLTTTNWSPAGSPTLSTQTALFNNNIQLINGVNMNTMGGAMTIAAIHFSTSATTGRQINNSSTTVSGTLTLASTTINSIANTIIRNLSAGNHTITNGSPTNFGLALSNTTNNVISLDGTGNLVITSSISTISGNTPVFVRGSNTGATLTFNSTANTFVGDITINGDGSSPNNTPELVIAADGSLGNSSNNINIDGGRLTGNGTFTIASTRAIKTSSVNGSAISAKGGSSITFNGAINNYNSTVGSWAKQGTGILKLGGLSTYSGATAINNGTLQIINGNNRLPITTTISIGQASSNNLGGFDLNGNNQQIAGLVSTSGINVTANKNTLSSASNATLTLGDANNYSFGDGTTTNSGVISGLLSIIKVGSGTQIFGDINTYTGLTQINAGELRFSPNANENLNSSAVTLNGGTLGTSGITAASTLSFSTLNLANNSIISLETSNAHNISFANSSSVGWTASKTLTITGWQGTYTTSAGSAGTKGRIFIGNTATSLTAAQLSQILFFNGTTYFAATLLPTGELVPYCIAPVISFAGSNSPICAGSALTLSCSATGTLSPSFSWVGPNSFASSIQNPTISAATSAATGIYTVTAANGCATASSTISATINTSPTISALSNNSPVCAGNNLTFSLTTSGSTPTYTWAGPNSFASSVQNPTITGVVSAAAGTYTINVSNACGSASSTIGATVNTPPSITTATNNSPICAGSNLNFTLTTSGTTPTYTWAGPNSFTSNLQNPSITGATTLAAGVYTINISNTCGTAGSTVNATVNGPLVPSITITASPSNTICSGSSVTFSANVTNGGLNPLFQWKKNGFNVTTGSFYTTSSLATSNSITCTFTSNATCASPSTATSNIIVMVVNPTPTMTAVSSQTVCSGLPISAINFSSTPSSTATVFSWSNPDPNIGLASSGTGNIASYTPPIVASDELATITVSCTLSGCTSPPITFDLLVRSPALSTVWTGAVSTDWFNANNWSNCVCGSVTNATIAAAANQPLITGTVAASVNSLTISSSAILSIQNTQTLNVSGDWINNGTFNAQQGNVILGGTSSTQNIGGSSSTSFYDLTLNNTNGAVLTTTQNITGSLYLNSGTFNTNNILTLVASSSGTGRIAPINPSADIINKVTAQQYAPGPNQGWALMGAPISSALTMSDWNDNFVITCPTCPDGYFNFTSIYKYNETAAGTYSATAKYVPINNITDNINLGVGYWVYLGNSTNNSINFDVKGTVAKSSCLTCGSPVTIPLSFTSNSGPTNDGWNLISNPLPSPISWSALLNSNPNVDNAVYAYNTDLLGGSGDFTSYINGVSSDPIGSGGIDDNIAMAQGFYVHATAPATLTANESVKVNTHPAYLRTLPSASVSSAIKPIARLVMEKSGNYNDMTTFYFENGGTPQFQVNYDAYKLINDPTLPYVGSISSGTILTDINGLSNFTSNMTIPVKAMTGTTGTFTFSLLKSNFPNNICVKLYDAFTGVTTDLLSNTYIATLYDTTTTARFTINFGTTPMTGTTTVSQPNCITPSGGSITAIANSTGPWDYVWTNSSSVVVKTSLAKNAPDTLNALSGGNYTVKVNTTGQCDNFSQTVNVNSIVLPVSQFATNVDTTYLSLSGQVNTTNTSVNGSSYKWNFGDASGYLTSFNPSHNYSAVGIYTISLITQSSNGCMDSTGKQIVVLNTVAGISEINASPNTVSLYSLPQSGQYLLKIVFDKPKDISISITNINGQTILSNKIEKVSESNYTVDLSTNATGIYILRTETEEGVVKNFKLKKD